MKQETIKTPRTGANPDATGSQPPPSASQTSLLVRTPELQEKLQIPVPHFPGSLSHIQGGR